MVLELPSLLFATFGEDEMVGWVWSSAFVKEDGFPRLQFALELTGFKICLPGKPSPSPLALGGTGI